MKNKKTVCWLLTILFLLSCLSGCIQPGSLPDGTAGNSAEDTSAQLPEGSAFAVHFIDVGQADAALVLCDGKSMLIDGGNRADGDLIYTYLQKQNLSYLDYVVCTHPDEDHVGGLAAALTCADAGTVYCPVTSYSSKAFTNFADKAAEGRHGTYTKEIVKPADELDEALVCECEGVSVAEVNYAVNSQHVTNMIDLRRRTRVGMGTCQGQLCSCRAAGLLCQGNHADKAAADLADFIDERWKGMKPVAWGATLNEAQLITMVYEDLCGVNQFVKEGGMK